MIKINIDMPKDCMECPCCTCDDSGNDYWCQALSNYDFDNDFLYFLDRGRNGRDLKCPIIVESDEETIKKDKSPCHTCILDCDTTCELYKRWLQKAEESEEEE